MMMIFDWIRQGCERKRRLRYGKIAVEKGFGKKKGVKSSGQCRIM